MPDDGPEQAGGKGRSRSAGASGRAMSALPDLITIALALLLFAVFHPAVMSNDSVQQYRQAATRQYNDWHPPLMSVVLTPVLACGGSISWLMLAQCVAGVFGLRALVSATLHFLGGQALPKSATGWVSLGVLLLFLSPLSPLAFYLMTFWKDCWAMILLLWIAAWSMGLYERAKELSRGGFVVRFAVLAGLMTLFGMTRYNAVVALPPLGLCLWTILRRRKVRFAFAAALVPLLLTLGLNAAILRALSARKMHIENCVMALDLAGLCVLDESFIDRLPMTGRYLNRQAYRQRYRWGEVSAFMWETPPVLDPEMVAPEHTAELHAEYWMGARKYPFAMAQVKWKGFRPLLGWERTHYVFHDRIEDNEFGLAINGAFAGVRELMSYWTGGAMSNWPWRWVLAVHGVWFLAGILWIAGAVTLYRRRRQGRFLILAWLCLTALAYYASYLPASPANDYRFMYPATLLIQVLSVCLAAKRLTRRGKQAGQA